MGGCVGIFTPLMESTIFGPDCHVAVFVEPRFGSGTGSFDGVGNECVHTRLYDFGDAFGDLGRFCCLEIGLDPGEG